MVDEAADRPRKPDHVPDELYWDHDFDDYIHDLGGDPFEAISEFYDGPPIFFARSASHVPAWILTRFEDQEEIFTDYQHFSVYSEDKSKAPFYLGVDVRLNPNAYDPPMQRVYRRILEPLFTPRAVKEREAGIRQLCRDLISKFEDKDGADFRNDFARYFPTSIFLQLMGMPLERFEQFMEWEAAFMHGPPDERQAALLNIDAFLESYVAERREKPGDDIVSHLLASEVDGRPLNHDEIMGYCLLFYIAGLDTVLSSLCWQFNYLAQDQALQERLRDNPGDILKAIDEMLRAFGLSKQPRVVAKDVVFRGVMMKKGDRIAVPTCFASRDASQYDDPNKIDIDRKARHLTFGSGNHICLGRHLARLEMRIVFEEWLSRFKNIRLAEGAKPDWHGGGVIALDSLPLVWDRIE